MPGSNTDCTPVSTGIPGLDHILRGGLPDRMVYLVHGGPGTGKTTLAFQFMQEGVRRGERVLFASLLQRRGELERIFGSHGWTLEGIDLLDLPAHVRQIALDEQTMFSPGELELQEITETILAAIDKHQPQRMVFDSITELSVLVESPHQLRRQMLKFKEKLDEINCTSIFTANDRSIVDLPSLQTAVHGAIQLAMDQPAYGPVRRWIEVIKLRGQEFLTGRHDFCIQRGGVDVYPRLETGRPRALAAVPTILSGNDELDTLFGGGLEGGTACLITGTTGAGKSTLAAVYVDAAAQRGERSIVFCFDERIRTFLRRSDGLGLHFSEHIDNGLVDLRQIDFGNVTFGQFAHELRTAINQRGVRMVVIDSLIGFYHSMPDDQLIVQLHEIVSYLNDAGVLTLMLVPMHGMGVFSSADSEVNTSYIADTVVVMRHFEANGEMRRCLSVLKKRFGHHEASIREFKVGTGGIQLGPPLTAFRNVLSGTPLYTGDVGHLMR